MAAGVAGGTLIAEGLSSMFGHSGGYGGYGGGFGGGFGGGPEIIEERTVVNNNYFDDRDRGVGRDSGDRDSGIQDASYDDSGSVDDSSSFDDGGDYGTDV